MERLLVRATRIVAGDRILHDGALRVENGRIAWVGPARDLVGRADRTVEHDGLVVPGFLDLQVNGCGGHDVMAGSAETVARIASALAHNGTTGFLATTISATVEDHLAPLLERLVRDLATTQPTPGVASLLGFHCEGPFLAEPARGAHAAANLQDPTPARVQRLLSAAGDRLRLVTLAPERPGALAAIAAFRARGVLVSLGHTTASPEVIDAAVTRGASLCTHLFNGMSPFHHREPGPAGAVLVNDGLTACLIPDGVHLDPRTVNLVLRAKGAARTLAVTDATAAAGMPDGRYPLGPGTMTVRDGICRDDAGSLAGSALTMDRAFANLLEFTGCDLNTAVALTSGNAAELLGLGGKKGLIAAGADADLVCLDGQHRAVRTFCPGVEAT
jgi:N-acetylglucosamine-6-phosphate deacetylase